MSTTETYTQLIEAVHDTRRAWRLRRALEGVLLLIAVAIAAATVATLLDWWVHFGQLGRSVLALLGWSAVGLTAWHALLRPLTALHSDDYFAALLEQKQPTLRNRLINALQLGRDANGSSPGLVSAIVSDGAQMVDELELGKAVASPRLRDHGIALGVAMAAAVLLLAVGGPAVQTSFARVLLPTANIAPFTWTTLDVTLTPADARILEGQPVTLNIATAGRTPDEARIHWTDASDDDSRTRTARAERGRDGQFRYAFPAVQSSFAFHVTAGDARSDTVHVHVDARPRLDRLAVTYTYPPYADLEPRTIDDFDGHLHALPQSRAALTFTANKPLDQLTVHHGDQPLAAQRAGDDNRTWQAELPITEPGSYRIALRDQQGYQLDAPVTYTINLERDAPPAVAILRPGRDLQLPPDAELGFRVAAQDDYGLDEVTLRARLNDADDERILHRWSNAGDPQRRVEHDLNTAIDQLDLTPGDRLEYWAVAHDRNDVTGPGRAETRRYLLRVLSPEQAQAELDKQMSDYARVVAELIQQQRRNRALTAEHDEAVGLIDRQGMIRRQTRQLADVMARQSFPGQSIIDELVRLAEEDMAHTITRLESYRDAASLDASRPFATEAVTLQDGIVESLEAILVRLNRADEVRQRLRRREQTDPVEHREVLDVLEQLAADLDAFLGDLRDMEETYEKLHKRDNDEEITGDLLADLEDVEHRLDRWKQWEKDSVDAITKLPQGFVPDAFLLENVSTIFEEIERQERQPVQEIATPVEEGVKALAEEVAEDLEMWMPHTPDSTRWVMEDPPEGAFEVPEAELPSSLQDIIGDLVEDATEYDEMADDVTGAWGGNMQMGWEINDGPISSFYAQGKTGNQLPNASEMGGRSGSGRRGRASGQMVGGESRGMEGRPTPARLTNEPYEEGMPNVEAQLDPRGATGGGTKTGGGQRGLQGGTPPDFVQDMERLAEHQALLREQAQQVARQLEYQGRPLSQVQRAIELMEGAETDYRDLRYDDAARKRKAALDALREAGQAADHGMHLSLQQARHLPPELREQVGAGSQRALPEGYEDLVGAYYRALSEDVDE
ncbi:MAG: hypothetical protein WDZ31_14655 [Phycisphaeraceae bacterium]